MPIEPDMAKAMDTRVNSAGALVSAASFLIAGFSFFAFQYLDHGQACLRNAAVFALILLLLSVFLCLILINLASNIYAMGSNHNPKWHARIGPLLGISSILVFVSILIFVWIAYRAISGSGVDGSAARESLHYECAVDYGEDGSRKASMNCTRTIVQIPG